MSQRDEYEREFSNQTENRLPILNNDQQEQDGSRLLLTLLRSYA